MSEKLKKLFRFYMVWQDEEEEIWLRNMSMEGWHLLGVRFGMIYTFAKGTPKNYCYRLDYRSPFMGEKGEYIDLFRDFGWIYITEVFNGWYYFRTSEEVENYETAEIYTDRSSKIEKNKRVSRLILPLMLLNFGIGVFNFILGIMNYRNPINTSTVCSVLNISVAFLLAYVMYRISKRLKTLKSKL